MDSYPGTAQAPASSQDLAHIADELLEHTRTLRRQHEELRDVLAGITAVAPRQPLEVEEDETAYPEHNGGAPDALYPMVLQMALAGEPREFAVEQLHVLEVEGAEELVEDVYERVESQRPAQKRRLFARRGD